ncbi:MAG: response regulator transcription factor [Nocardioides sp.]|uniref:response regulator transcription factor n=1 Tax=Nocardioides sp. TaxID=35761 RepID=UPI003F08679F
MTAPSEWVAVVIEDDPDVRELIDVVLSQSGFRTVLAPDGESGLEAVRTHRPLLTTVDVQMPGIDGLEVSRRIREFSSTYLIMVTGLAEEDDVVRGFEAGVDDYLVKPFRARELWARAQSMMRRPRERVGAGDSWAAAAVAELRERGLPAAAAAEGDVHRLVHAGLTLDAASRTVAVDEVPVDLTRTEFDVLESLLRSGRRVRSKADLVLAARGEDDAGYVTDSDKRAVEVHVANLRRKLGESASSPRFVETVRGVGYRMAEATTELHAV